MPTNVLRVNDSHVPFKNFLAQDGTYPALDEDYLEGDQWLRDLAFSPNKTYKLREQPKSSKGAGGEVIVAKMLVEVADLAGEIFEQFATGSSDRAVRCL